MCGVRQPRLTPSRLRSDFEVVSSSGLRSDGFRDEVLLRDLADQRFRQRVRGTPSAAASERGRACQRRIPAAVQAVSEAPSLSLTICLDDFAAMLIGHAKHRDLLNRGMQVDHFLDLARIDIEAAATGSDP